MDRRTPWMAALLAASALACGGMAGSPAPSRPTPPGEVPTAEQAAWLEPHDAVRAGSFPGVTVSPAPSPPLPALAWSVPAAAVAQAWAEGCSYAHNAGRGADGTPRGENIAAFAPAGSAGATPTRVVGLWAGEWPDYDYASNGCAAGKVCGHYTQLVWRATMRVGCGHATCNTGSPFQGFTTWDFFVCDYEPPGNWAGQRPY